MAVFLYPPISVSTSTGPSTFIQDGAQQVVTEDTVTPANNAPFPSKLFIQKDGQPLPVTKDTGTPANNVAVPVELVGASGPINITAGDLNVQLTDLGSNFDRTRIGDGTNQWNMNASNEGLVHDADVLVELGNIKTAVTGLATQATLSSVLTNQTNSTQLTKITDGAGTVNTKQLGTALTGTDVGLVTNTTIHGLNSSGGGTYVDVKVNPAGKLLVEADVTTSALPTGAATAANQTTANTSLSTIVTNTGNTNTNIVELNSNVGDLTDVAAGSDTGSFSILAFIKRGMQNWTTLLGVLPSAKGQQVKANSLSVTLATDQGALPVTPTNNSGTITNAQVTVGTSAVRATVSGSAPNAARKKLIIKSSKNNTGSIYLGSSSVTTANGLEIIGPDRLEFELDASDYYLISDTAAQVVEVLEVV